MVIITDGRSHAGQNLPKSVFLLIIPSDKVPMFNRLVVTHLESMLKARHGLHKSSRYIYQIVHEIIDTRNAWM